MYDRTEQERRLRLVATAAQKHDCLIAPVGSVYFLFRGVGRQLSKDLDAVVHDHDLNPADLSALKKIAAELGAAEVAIDEAVVAIRTDAAAQRPDIELIRGRSRAKGGFFPRALLIDAGRLAERQGNILFYPLEFVLALKADAAVDRRERALRDKKRASQHLGRARAFEADIFEEVREAMLGKGLDRDLFRRAVGHLKQNRAEAVLETLRSAGAPTD